MKILTVDIGTGTQDIYLYDSNLDMENNFKLVVPSPTMIIHRQIKQATQHGDPILLTGKTMGGGPSTWATEAHLRAGYQVYATPEAAQTINDDLESVEALGVELVSANEAEHLGKNIRKIQLLDFDFQAIQKAFESFGVSLNNLTAIAVGVFDHGNAPANISDRQFRFDYLDERIRKLNRLSAFAYTVGEVPNIMTRMKAVVESATAACNAAVVVMDTAPAAVLGATLDPLVGSRERVMIVNVGNFHTLAFRMGRNGIEGLFEHHTGMIDREKLEKLLHALAEGTLRREDVYDDMGHGALVYDPSLLMLDEGDFDVVVTGPRRSIFQHSTTKSRVQSIRPYFPAPYGDMMITGCFGLLRATADVLPELADAINGSLFPEDTQGVAPWDLD